MGQGESKELNKELNLFSVEERNHLKNIFNKLTNGSNKIEKQTLEQVIKQMFLLPESSSLAQQICDSMSTSSTVDFDGYVHCAAIMIKGMLEDRVTQFMSMANGRKDEVSVQDCLDLLTQIVCFVMHITRDFPTFHSWKGFSVDSEVSNTRLALALLKELVDTEKTNMSCFDKKAVNKWFVKCNLLSELFSVVSHHIFQFPSAKVRLLLPLCRGPPPTQVYSSWLTLADIVFINSSLPTTLQSEWRFLFSSKLHGESFSSLLGNVIDKGPSVIFVKDIDGYIFGGFASVSWSVGPQFKGTGDSFVFTLNPDMVIYNSTGYNDHYQYLNIQQQTFPNGLGMGGQLEYFAIWIDSEYGKGKCSPTCTTFNCGQLSGKPEFFIDTIEVWAVGPEPAKDEDEEMRPSILDVDLEGTAMLRMLNRGPVSEGMRENPTADEPEEKDLYLPSVSSEK